MTFDKRGIHADQGSGLQWVQDDLGGSVPMTGFAGVERGGDGGAQLVLAKGGPPFSFGVCGTPQGLHKVCTNSYVERYMLGGRPNSPILGFGSSGILLVYFVCTL